MERNTATVYKPGEIVWVKIPNCPWWPAEVINESDFPDLEPKGKKTIVAYVKFLNEEYCSVVCSHSKIQQFQVANYKELKQKAEKDNRRSISEKIGPAFELALARLGIQSSSPLSEETQKSQTSSDNIGQNENGAEDPFESAELSRGTRKRKQVEKYVPSLPDPTSKKRRNVSTGSLTPKNQKRRLSEPLDSPAIPYPSETNLITDKTVVSLLEVQSSLGAAVKRSLEAEYSSCTSVNNKELYPAESISVQHPSSPEVPQSLSSPLFRSLHTKKLLSARFTNLAHQMGMNDDSPTNDSDVGKALSRCSSSVSSYDSHLDSESSDSDADLPEALSPSVTDSTALPAVRDVVWVKFKHFVFWPAVVRRIQKCKRRGRPMKIQVQFLGETGHFKENFYVTYNRNRVLPLDTARRKEFEDVGRQCEDRERFLSSLKEVDAYLNKKALGLLPPDKEESFFDEDYNHDNDSDGSDTAAPTGELPAEPTQEINKRLVLPPAKNTSKKRTNQTLEMMQERRKRKNQVLVDFITSLKMKEYLVDIINGKRKCERHTQFVSSVRERDNIRNYSFGQIVDEDQQDKITSTLFSWYRGLNPSCPSVDYIMDVWVPEALVYSMIKIRGYGRSKAWQMFHQGSTMLKAERQEMHNHLIETAKNISPEDARLYDECRKERMECMMDDLEN